MRTFIPKKITHLWEVALVRTEKLHISKVSTVASNKGSRTDRNSSSNNGKTHILLSESPLFTPIEPRVKSKFFIALKRTYSSIKTSSICSGRQEQVVVWSRSLPHLQRLLLWAAWRLPTLWRGSWLSCSSSWPRIWWTGRSFLDLQIPGKITIDFPCIKQYGAT